MVIHLVTQKKRIFDAQLASYSAAKSKVDTNINNFCTSTSYYFISKKIYILIISWRRNFHIELAFLFKMLSSTYR